MNDAITGKAQKLWGRLNCGSSQLSFGGIPFLSSPPLKPPSFSIQTSLLASTMCWQRNKTPGRWPNCTKTGGGPCSTHDPDHDFIERCPAARARGSDCANPAPTSQASSTHRNKNCPNHRNKAKPPSGSGQGNEGAGIGTQPESQMGVKVGA
jgi:hypothetical protein